MMFIRNNGPKDLTKFNGIPYAVYWYEIKGQTLVDEDVGFVEKNEYDFNDEKYSSYFKDNQLF